MNKKMLKNKINELRLAGNWQALETLERAMRIFGLAPWYNEYGEVEEITRIK